MCHFILPMFYLLAVLAVAHANGEVELSIETTGYPSFYKDEPITMTCTASGDNAISAVYLVNGVSVSDPWTWTACRYDTFVNEWVAINALNIPGVSRIDKAYCLDATAAASPFILSVTGAVTDVMVGVNLKCFADITTRVNSSTVSISRIDVKPGSIQLNSPSEIVEGVEFTFSCSSTGGSPDSVYAYEVLRGDVVVVSNNTYTPVKGDREDLTLRCNDTAHAALAVAYPNLITASKEVKPHFLVYGEEQGGSIERNPTGLVTLLCEVSSNPDPSYNWTCDNACSGITARELVIPANSGGIGLETISCTASIDGLTPITITWNVSWTLAATIPPTTASTTTTEATSAGLGTAAIVGIVVAVLVVGVAVVLIIFFYRKHKGASGKQGKPNEEMGMVGQNTGGGDKAKAAQKNEPKQKRNSKSKTQAPPAPNSAPKPNYTDDTIVYAELEHDSTPCPKVAKVKPIKPPDESVPYASINFEATKAYRQRQQNGNDELYENVNDNPSKRPMVNAPPPNSRA